MENCKEKAVKGGYKAMLRDRMLLTTDLALKRCKCKKAYINYVYDRFVRCVPVELRKNAVKEVLGLKVAMSSEMIRVLLYKNNIKITSEQAAKIPNQLRFFRFRDTIGWEELKKNDPELYKRFKIAASWVEWFRVRFQDVENTYIIGKKTGKSDEQIRLSIADRYRIDDDTITFLFKYFKR